MPPGSDGCGSPGQPWAADTSPQHLPASSQDLSLGSEDTAIAPGLPPLQIHLNRKSPTCTHIHVPSFPGDVSLGDAIQASTAAHTCQLVWTLRPPSAHRKHTPCLPDSSTCPGAQEGCLLASPQHRCPRVCFPSPPSRSPWGQRGPVPRPESRAEAKTHTRPEGCARTPFTNTGIAVTEWKRSAEGWPPGLPQRQ